jgi:hypothetical protein
MTQNVAYFSGVTEYESGWGNRPDGYVVAKSEELFNAKAVEIKAAGTYAEFSSVNGPAKLCLVTDEMAKTLEEKGAVWVNGSEWHVKS